MTGPLSSHRVAIARRNYGDAIVATIAMQLPAIFAWVSADRAGQVFWEIVLAVGPALAIGRTAFLYGQALGWSRPKCWVAAFTTGLVGIAAWIMYYVLAPAAAKPVTSDSEGGPTGRPQPGDAPRTQRDER